MLKIMKNKIVKNLRLLILGTVIAGTNFVAQGDFTTWPKDAFISLLPTDEKDLFDSLNEIWMHIHELSDKKALTINSKEAISDSCMQTLGALIAESKALEILKLKAVTISRQGIVYLAQGIIQNYLNGGNLSIVTIDATFDPSVEFEIIKIVTITSGLNPHCNVIDSTNKVLQFYATFSGFMHSALKLGLIPLEYMNEENLLLLAEAVDRTPTEPYQNQPIYYIKHCRKQICHG